MSHVASRSRQPAGIPNGGQFAPTRASRAEVTLTPDQDVTAQMIGDDWQQVSDQHDLRLSSADVARFERQGWTPEDVARIARAAPANAAKHAARDGDRTPPTRTVSGEQRRVIADQIGARNILAISGGRITALPDGIELPVSAGY